MQTNVLLPQVELTMDQVLVVKWLVKVGSAVQPEQPLLEVETQKAVTQVPAPCKGYVRKTFVKEGDLIGEKSLLCVLTETAEEHFEEIINLNSAYGPQVSPSTAAVLSAEAVDGLTKATPAARRVARELGVPLSTIIGTGPAGRITEQDVQVAAGTSCNASKSSNEWISLPATRLALIAQMQKSLLEIPQIHLSRSINVTALFKKLEGITFTHQLVAVVARSLQKHPSLRTVIIDGKIRVEPVSVAVAMDTSRGLVAPALRGADQMSVAEISVALKELRVRAQSNRLHHHELVNAPFAVTNLGMFGIDFFNAFVFHGQTAVLSIGRATDTNDEVKVAWFGLAADHRVVDGAEGARFLQTLQTEILTA